MSNYTNPILPAPGVSRNLAINTEASRYSDRQNDDVVVNRDSRGTASDNSRCLRALLRCKETIILGIFNANTLRIEDRQLELQHCSEINNIGILGIQEHRIIHRVRKLAPALKSHLLDGVTQVQASKGG